MTNQRQPRRRETRINKPRIFLGSSGQQARLLQAITRGLEDVADVEPWTTTFNPGRSTLDRLVELSQEVDFAAFVFAQDDWTTTDAVQSGQASPRDNVVFEAGLFGGALGIRRTFIIHAHGSKLPTDLLGLTAVRYDPASTPAEVRAINSKLRKAIEAEGRRGLVEGLWWQLSLTARSEGEPSAVSLLRISRDRDGGLNVAGRGWQEDGTLSVRYWSEAAKERRDPASIFYFWKGERPRHPNAPQLEGTGEIKVDTTDRATGYWTTRSDRDPGLNARTSGVYRRADPSDLQVLDGGTEEERAQLIAQRLQDWKSAANAFLAQIAQRERRRTRQVVSSSSPAAIRKARLHTRSGLVRQHPDLPLSARQVELGSRSATGACWPAGPVSGPWRGNCVKGNVMPDEGFTELAGPRVALRRFHPGDVAEFVAYRSSVPVARFQSWDAPFPREEGERFVRELATEHPDTPGAWFQFAVALRPDGQLIGDCAAMPQAGDSRQCEIGFTIAPKYQGHGYATEAVRLLLGYLFTARGKHRITACCDPRNAASVALLERLGMRREGQLRQSTWAKGEWTDDLVYALLHDEWQSG